AAAPSSSAHVTLASVAWPTGTIGKHAIVRALVLTSLGCCSHDRDSAIGASPPPCRRGGTGKRARSMGREPTRHGPVPLRSRGIAGTAVSRVRPRRRFAYSFPTHAHVVDPLEEIPSSRRSVPARVPGPLGPGPTRRGTFLWIRPP